MDLQGCADMKKFAGKRVCVACSGGADSLCLLHYLSLRATQDGFVLSAVHIEHGLRGEKSKADAAFVADFCKQKDIPLFSFSFDCRALAAKEKIGVEEAARKARYGAFETLLSDNKADVIATAHHANDEAETVLFNLLRGSSLTGAGGIKEARRGIFARFCALRKRKFSLTPPKIIFLSARMKRILSPKPRGINCGLKFFRSLKKSCRARRKIFRRLLLRPGATTNFCIRSPLRTCAKKHQAGA